MNRNNKGIIKRDANNGSGQTTYQSMHRASHASHAVTPESLNVNYCFIIDRIVLLLFSLKMHVKDLPQVLEAFQIQWKLSNLDNIRLDLNISSKDHFP